MNKIYNEPAIMPLPLDSARIIKTTADFNRVYNNRHSSADNNIIVYCMENHREHPRLGVSVGKKLGNAVIRNNYKRKLREAFRLSQHDLPSGFDYILIPRKTGHPSCDRYRKSLLILAAKLQNRRTNKNPELHKK